MPGVYRPHRQTPAELPARTAASDSSLWLCHCHHTNGDFDSVSDELELQSGAPNETKRDHEENGCLRDTTDPIIWTTTPS